MKVKQQVHNLIILDESGSMSSIKGSIIQGFNEIVQTIHGIEAKFPEQEHFISFVSFNGIQQNLLHFVDPAKKLKRINDRSYQPEASTPLYDAMGFAINKLKAHLKDINNYTVLVTILTDGEENASKEFSGAMIKSMVEELSQNHWTFTYIGTDHDVVKIASSLSIKNHLMFEKNEEQIQYMFAKERTARSNFSQKLNDGEDTESDYFEI
jgi:hypothetical protein